jgi:hypothetical protein
VTISRKRVYHGLLHESFVLDDMIFEDDANSFEVVWPVAVIFLASSCSACAHAPHLLLNTQIQPVS